MLGLERVYYEVDGARKRVIRLIEMERLPDKKGMPIIDKIHEVMGMVNDILEEEDGVNA